MVSFSQNAARAFGFLCAVHGSSTMLFMLSYFPTLRIALFRSVALPPPFISKRMWLYCTVYDSINSPDDLHLFVVYIISLLQTCPLPADVCSTYLPYRNHVSFFSRRSQAPGRAFSGTRRERTPPAQPSYPTTTRTTSSFLAHSLYQYGQARVRDAIFCTD
jgi:hypothetical protein